ncbi:uncharacterized protein PAC_14633 [Phialocephala subalpina]|uniref:Glucanase n=1 Tax=Phialocephala subalpina TaxID=576137 RepID=A0A1L7XI80_9HELO|nr:uncharacterized protein PAC_14633 [Phialocephala subalpina]
MTGDQRSFEVFQDLFRGNCRCMYSPADILRDGCERSLTRKEQRRAWRKQIVELVLYNLPDRDYLAGETSGEFGLDDNGLELYKHSFVDPYAAALKAAKDLCFAVILEPDSLGNVITNQNVPLCADASSGYEEGIAYAIAQLQSPHIALHIDAAHGGWLGWDGSLPLAAAEFAKVVTLASNFTKNATIRGFSTDVSNYNPYIANPRANYTQYSNSYDELDYATSLAPYLTNASNAFHHRSRTEWPPEYPRTLIDSIVWVKPSGESDGVCGPTIDGVEAPGAGLWWEAYVENLVKKADPPLPPISS